MVDPLLQAIGELASADTLERVMQIVRSCARSLSHADGVTFVLREHDHCYYAEQYALQALANAAGVALKNMRLYQELRSTVGEALTA